MFGQGAQIQGGRMDDKLLLLQIASDLAEGRFEKAEFVMVGH